MLDEEIETLRGQMQDITAREEALLHGLAASLYDAEQRLLGHVRTIAAQHSERRMRLIGELRALASGLGATPTADMQDTTALVAPDEDVAQVTYTPAVSLGASGGGSWRDAARMINDDEDSNDTEIGRLLRANVRQAS